MEAKLWSLLHSPEGPLARYLDAIAQHLNEQGFRRRTIAVQIRLIAQFSLWLKEKAVSLDELSDEHVVRYLQQTKRRRSVCPMVDLQPCLFRLMAFLRRAGTVKPLRPAPSVAASPIQAVVVAFGEHLRDVQALSRATCRHYLPFAEQFLIERFGDGAVELSNLCAADVVGFIRRQASRLSSSRAKSATIAMRSFLRYLRLRGDVTVDLVAAVPTVPNWSMTGIPRAIAPDHLRAVLESCRRDMPVGCRDYAILLLLARLGLRSGEIVALTLDSVDWERGCLTVIGSKSGQSSELPLPVEVGSAIAEYLQRGRPRSDCRHLFLRANAPVRELGSQTSIGSIVVAAIARAGVRPLHRGAHQFRHALACEMLRQGANLTEIGSLLRHQHQKTTSIYAKVDLAALRSLSLTWPGVAR
ncbi:MAG: integrase [Mesorhizobium sp.]|nr:MAG: integrase [Mesorhizobium sp.]